MNINVTPVEGKVPVTIMQIQGELDASNFKQVITSAKDLYASGTRNLLLDLGDMPYMASSGLVALHSVVLLMQGQTPPDPEAGWGAIRSIDRNREAGMQPYVKLLNPQPRVDRVLKMAGFDRFFEIYIDQETAIASF